MRQKKRGLSISQKKLSNFNDNKMLEVYVGGQVWAIRKKLGVTISQLASQSKLSSSMLSKIENAQTSPSFATIQAICTALNVPVKRLFEKFEDQADLILTKSGQGVTIERQGTKVGHHYQLLGHICGKYGFKFEPCLITITDNDYEFSSFKHSGIEFIYMLEGNMEYRHGNNVYKLAEGDSICFDSSVIHGPESIKSKSCKFLATLVGEQS